MMTSDIVYFNVEIEIPQEALISKISYAYPTLQIKLISILQFHHIIQIDGHNLDQVELTPKFADLSIFFRDQHSILFSIQTKNSTILNILSSSNLQIKFPLILRQGKLVLETVGRRDELDRIIDLFQASSVNIKIFQILRYTHDKLLTSKQNSLLHYAFHHGFFEIPRKITITQLSKIFHISKSAISELLRRALKKILTKYY